MVCLLAAQLAGRRIDVVGDAAYATGSWRGVPGGVTVTSRRRHDAAIYARRPPRTGRRGRPAKWGQRLPRLAQIALDPATEWTEATVRRYGKPETLMLTVIDCLWQPPGADTPVRVILVKDESKISEARESGQTTALRGTGTVGRNVVARSS